MSGITKRALLGASAVAAARLGLGISAGGVILPKVAKAGGAPAIPPAAPYVLQQGVGHLYNYSPAKVRRIRAALAKVRAGIASGYIACLARVRCRATMAGPCNWPRS